MNQVSSGSPRDPEGSINFGFNLWHEVVDRTFFYIILLVVLDPQIPPEGGEKLDIWNPRFVCFSFINTIGISTGWMDILVFEKEGGIPQGGDSIKGQVS